MIRRSFDENGDYSINSFIDKSAATIQAVSTRLRLFRGEWFLNILSGVPYYQDILGKNKRLDQIETDLRDTILQTEGVEKLTKFDLDYTSNNRKLALDFSGTTIYDDDGDFEVIGLNI